MESEYGGRDDAAVSAIPAGDVPVALQVFSILKASFDLIVSRKLKMPGNPESGIGALSLGGEVFLNRSLISDLRIKEEDIKVEISAVKVDLEKRNPCSEKAGASRISRSFLFTTASPHCGQMVSRETPATFPTQTNRGPTPAGQPGA